MAGRPVLWHIPVSHYNEKARWALDYKSVPHERRAPPLPSHMAISLLLTRGSSKTFPVLQIDGETYGDSTEIIEVLERLYPDPPLYPDDPGERSRALEIEEFFDEQVAPDVRRLAWHEVIKDPESFGRFAVGTLPGPLRGPSRRLAGPFGTWFVKVRFGAGDPEGAALARTRVEAGIDRLDAELADGREFLVGDRFSVADLTAAAILYPVVRPPEGPQGLPETPEQLQRFFDRFEGRRSLEWIREMFRRHRHKGRAAAAAAPSAAAPA
jgi:glutathione S-transferase